MKFGNIIRLSRIILMVFAIILACQKDPLIDVLKPQISLLQIEYNQSKHKLDQLKTENTELKQKISSLQESYVLLQKQYQDELSGSEALQNEIDGVEKQLQTTIENNRLKRSALLTTLAELKEKVKNSSEEFQQLEENQKLLDETTKALNQVEKTQPILQELQNKIAEFQSDLNEHLLKKKEYEDLESEHSSKLDEISQLEKQIEKAEKTLEKLRLDFEINQLDQQLSDETSTNGLIEKVESDLADLNQQIKKLSTFAEILPKLKESLSETIETEKNLQLQLGDLKHEFYLLTGNTPPPAPVVNGPSIQVDSDMPKRFFIGDIYKLNYSFFNQEGVLSQPTGLVLWSSNNEKILKIDEVSGEIQAMGLGTVEVSITTQIDDQVYEDSLTIDVSNLLKHRVEIVQDIPNVFMPNQKHDLEFAYFDERGEKVTQPEGKVTWKSSNTQVLSVHPNTGEITALKSGSATIIVSLEHPENGVMTYSYQIQVQSDSIPPRLVIHDKPSNSRIGVNETYDLNFEYYNSSGQKVDIPNGLSFIWRSTETTKVTINSSTGVITGVAAGTSVISVSTIIEGQIISDRITITVSDGSVPNDADRVEIVETDFPNPFLVGQAHRFTLQFFDSNGNKINAPNGTAVWKSSKNRNARPNNSGEVTAERKGDATITVTFTISGNSKTLTDSYDITVEQGPAIRIIENIPSNFAPPQTFTLSYHYWNASGIKVNPPDGIRWKSATKSVATIDNRTGEVTAVGAGTSVITITTQESNNNDRISDTYEITVGGSPTVEPELRIIDLPTNSTISINGMQDLNFEYFDHTGTKSDLPQGATVTWTSSDTTKITIDTSSGVMTGVAEGTSDITVTATIDGKTITKTETITVSAGSVSQDADRIEIVETDFPDPFLVGQAHRFTLQFFDSNGNKINAPNGTAVWKSSKNRNARPNNSGEVTAERKGDATITVTFTISANSKELMDTYDITVEQGPAIRIIENLPSNFAPPQKHTLTYHYWNASGAKVDPPDGIRWRSATKSVATIDNSTGEVTAVGAGTSVITITTQESNNNDRISDTYEITVGGGSPTVEPELRIIDLPNNSTITINGTHDLDFEYYDNTGTKANLPTGVTPTWTSSDTTKITIDATTGVMTGVAAGTSDITASATIDGSPITARETITVSAGSLRTDGSRIEINEDLDLFFVGKTHTFTFTYYNNSDTETTEPAGSPQWTASNSRVTFSTSNIGESTGAEAGIVTITLRYTFDDDGSYLEDTYRFSVIEGSLVRILENLPEGFKKGQTHTLTAEYYDATGTKTTHPDGLSWSSNDENVATVDQNGQVTAVGPGSVRIRVVTQESTPSERKSTRYAFNVLTDPELKIIDLPDSSTIGINETQDLDFEYFDNTGTKVNLPMEATATWTSSDVSKITINASTGVITGVATGTSDIRVSTTIDGSPIMATETITVSAGSLRNDGSYITIQEDLPQLFFVGQTHMFAIKHYDSSDIEIAQPAGSAEWTASNSGMTFSTTTIGQGTAATSGTITITVRYTFDSDGNYLEDTYEIEVLQGPLVRIVEDIPEGFKKGQTHTLTADYYNSSGQKVTHPDGLTWTSRNADVATINRDSGLLTAVGPGTVTVVARTKGSTPRQSDTYAFTVLADSELKIIDLPPSSSITLSTSHDLNFEFYNSSGTKVNLPPGATVSWTSSDVSKVSVVSGTGVITGTGIGEADITASTTIDGATITAKATISVVAGSQRSDGSYIEIQDDLPDPFLVGQTHTFRIKYYDSTDTEITPLPAGSYEWTTTNNRITFSSSNSGVGVGAGPGTVKITVRYTFNSDGSYLEAIYRPKVIQGPLVQITENIPEGFKKGGRYILSAEYYDATGNNIGHPDGLSWSSSDDTVATVDSSTGEVIAVDPGKVTITVTTQESNMNSRINDTYEFDVLTDPDIKIIDLPTDSSINVGETHPLDYEYYDNMGAKVELPQGSTVTWTSSDSTKVSVDSSGVITGEAAGSADITATVSGTSISKTVTIMVLGIARADGTRIEIQENPSDLFFVGKPHQFTIKHYDSGDTEINSPPAGSAVWTANNPRMTFSTTNIGEGTGAEVGVVTITVRYTFDSDGNYLEDTYQIKVTQGPLIRILEDLPEGFKKGDTHTLMAEYYNASGMKMTHPDGLSWSSSDEAFATVSSSGLVTAIGPGNVRIRVVTQESDPDDRISDNYRFDVLTDPELKISNLPGTSLQSNILVGSTHGLNYEYYDNMGDKVNNLPGGATVTWTSSDMAKITINKTTGVITGVSAGESDITVSATIDGETITSSVTIFVLASAVPLRVEIIEDLPDPFIVGQKHTLKFDYYDSQGKAMPPSDGNQVWSSNKNRAAMISNTNELTAVRTGDYTIKLVFTTGGVTLPEDTLDVTIEKGPIVRIVDNVPTNFAVGDKHTMSFDYWDGTNTKVTPTNIEWKSKDGKGETGGSATIDESSGLLTAVKAGNLDISILIKDDDDKLITRHKITITVN